MDMLRFAYRQSCLYDFRSTLNDSRAELKRDPHLPPADGKQRKVQSHFCSVPRTAMNEDSATNAFRTCPHPEQTKPAVAVRTRYAYESSAVIDNTQVYFISPG